jgi:hypothetical protein
LEPRPHGRAAILLTYCSGAKTRRPGEGEAEALRMFSLRRTVRLRWVACMQFKVETCKNRRFLHENGQNFQIILRFCTVFDIIPQLRIAVFRSGGSVDLYAAERRAS